MRASFSPVIQALMDAFRCLPGVGPKSAQRMVLHLLERQPDAAQLLAEQLSRALSMVRRCTQCRMLTETDICGICASVTRNTQQVCVVESPADVLAVEQTGVFQGIYFVLSGHLSPIDGLGPEEIGLELLKLKLSAGGISEVIIATSPTVEGQATAYYISDMTKKMGIVATRIAHGVPRGSELEYIDHATLAQALSDRLPVPA